MHGATSRLRLTAAGARSENCARSRRPTPRQRGRVVPLVRFVADFRSRARPFPRALPLTRRATPRGAVIESPGGFDRALGPLLSPKYHNSLSIVLPSLKTTAFWG